MQSSRIIRSPQAREGNQSYSDHVVLSTQITWRHSLHKTRELWICRRIETQFGERLACCMPCRRAIAGDLYRSSPRPELIGRSHDDAPYKLSLHELIYILLICNSSFSLNGFIQPSRFFIHTRVKKTFYEKTENILPKI
jgi:hypothetical protein